MLRTNKSDLAAHSAGIELVGHGKLHEEKLISLAPFFLVRRAPLLSADKAYVSLRWVQLPGATLFPAP